MFLAWLIVIGLCLIISFLYSNLMEIVEANLNLGSVVINMVLWAALFVLLGSSLDSIYNRPLRIPVQITHETIQKAKSDPNLLESGSLANQHHILAMRPLKGVLEKPYTIVVKSYDKTMEYVNVIVDFDGLWYTCNVGNNLVYLCK